MPMNALVFDDSTKVDLPLMTGAAESLGLHVKSTASLKQFLKLSEADDYDVNIVDFKSSRVKPGGRLRDGTDVVALSAAQSRNIPSVLFTNFRPDCERRLEQHDPRLLTTVVSKPKSGRTDDWAVELEKAIRNLKPIPPRDPDALLSVPLDDLATPFFHRSPRVLRALKEVEREELELQVGLELHPYMLPVWRACSSDWLMLQRHNNVVLVVERGSNDSPPSLDAVAISEDRRHSAALVLGRPSVVEEGPAMIECSPDHPKDWRKYPYVSLIVNSGEEREFHLDTGTPTSYISYEFLEKQVSIPAVKPHVAILGDIGGRKDSQHQVPVNVELHVVSSDGNAPMAIKMHAVKGWARRTILNSPCKGLLCPDSRKPQCGRRHGLMGRDVLYGFADGCWLFDPNTGRFSTQNLIDD